MKKSKFILSLLYILLSSAINPLNSYAEISREFKGKLELTGSSTIAPLAAEIGKRFESLYPNVRVDIQTGGSSRGIADPVKGLADIGMSSRGLKDSEIPNRTSYTLARDGIALIVHSSNSVHSLTNEQIIAIFTKKVTNWKDVGGADSPITVINRTEGRSELELFTKYFGIKKQQIRADLISGENQHGIKSVSGDPHSIMYISVGTSEDEQKNGTPIKLLPLEGIQASTKTVKNDSYPLSRPLVLITSNEPSKLSTTFLDFALSDKVNDLIQEQAFVPVN